jgi:heme/copper-type cytochrome/quinol oxidase subunit 2
MRNWVRQEGMMSTITTEVGRHIFKMFAGADRDDALVPADQADLIVVLLFVAVGILLTVVFFMFGFWVEFGRILAAVG